MQKNRRFHKSRNKNRSQQMGFDSIDGIVELDNESNDSMLTVSDSLGNMDSMDSDYKSEIDKTLLDEFAGDSELSADHAYVEGSESAPRRTGATGKRANAPKKAQKAPSKAARNEASAPLALDNVAAKAKSKALVAGQTLKDKVDPMLSKAKDFIQPYREDLTLRFQDAYGVAKAKGKVLDKNIKTQPYVFALGAIVAGFALARIFTPSTSVPRSGT